MCERDRNRDLRRRLIGIALQRMDAIGQYGLSRHPSRHEPMHPVKTIPLAFIARVADGLENAQDEMRRKLNVERLLGLGDVAFWHDIQGIGAHYDPRQQMMCDCFVPICGYGKGRA